LDQAPVRRVPDQATCVVCHRDGRYDCRGVRGFSCGRKRFL